MVLGGGGVEEWRRLPLWAIPFHSDVSINQPNGPWAACYQRRRGVSHGLQQQAPPPPPRRPLPKESEHCPLPFTLAGCLESLRGGVMRQAVVDVCLFQQTTFRRSSGHMAQGRMHDPSPSDTPTGHS